MQKTLTTLAIVATSGTALAQSGLDIDRAYAAELRADANTRSSLLGTNNAAGITVDVFTQFRYSYNSRDAVAPDAAFTSTVNGTAVAGSSADFGDNDTTAGFSLPRTQIRMAGGVEGTDISGVLSFDFGGAFDRGFSAGNGGSAVATDIGDGDATLREAYGAWALDDNWTFVFGLFDNPIFFEDSIAPERSQGVEMSNTATFFDVGYTEGIALSYANDEMKFVGALSDGPALGLGPSQPANSFYTSGGESDISITGRLDWLFSGTWDQFSQFASWQGSNDGLRVGGGIHWSSRGDTNPNAVTSSVFNAAAVALGTTVDTEDVFVWTVDAQYVSDGWGLFAAYQSANVDADFTSGTSADATFDGFVLQGNAFLSSQFEAFARYDIIFLEDDASVGLPASSEDKYSTLTVGMNYYLVPESFAARFSLDVSFALDDSSGIDYFSNFAGDAGRTGTLGGGADTGGAGSFSQADDEFMIRAQMSLLF